MESDNPFLTQPRFERMVPSSLSDLNRTSVSTNTPELLEHTTISTGTATLFDMLAVYSNKLFYRWVCIRIDTLGGLFAAGLAAFLIYGPSKNASDTGFSLNMAGMSTNVA